MVPIFNRHLVCIFTVNEFNYTFFKIGNAPCDNLFFDKTKNLNGYNLKVVMWKNNINYVFDETKLGYERCISHDFRIMCTVLNRINATITVKQSPNIGSFDNDNEPQGALKDVLSNEVDMHMNLILQRDYWREQLYTYYPGNIKIIYPKTIENHNEDFFSSIHLDVWFFSLFL